MAGHNKWSKIKRTKGVADAQRGKLFTKLLREIQVSARIGGGDPKSNSRLRDAMTEARQNNMPKDNIERAVKRGCGELDGSDYEQITYEGYGPGGAALLIDCLTDNRNRTVAEIRAILTRNRGSLGEAGSVSWIFSKKGQITLEKKGKAENEDWLIETALEAGAEDILDQENAFGIMTPPEELESVRSALENNGVDAQKSELILVPGNTLTLQGEDAEQMLKLIDLLEDLDDVQKVHSNFDLSEQEMNRLTASDDQ